MGIKYKPIGYPNRRLPKEVERSIIINYLIGIKSPKEIANNHNVHFGTVHRCVQRAGIPTLHRLKITRRKNLGIKKCSCCGIEKSIDDFYAERSSWCKFCEKDFVRKTKEKVMKYFGRKCSKCGVSDLPSYCYDVHHINPEEKEFNISGIMTWTDFEKLKNELDKCILVCANCHRIIHHGELHDTL